MVSEHQTNTQGEQWGSEWEKYVHKPDQVLRGIIDGLQSIDDCRDLIEAEASHKRRTEVIGAVNERIEELRERDGENE